MTAFFRPKIPLLILEKSLDSQQLSIQHMQGDGSNKSFFRIKKGTSPKTSYILMELEEKNKLRSLSHQWDWTNVAKTLHKAQIKSPKIISTHPHYNSIVIEDCGNKLLATIINQQIKKKETSQTKDLLEKTHEILYKLSKITPSKKSFWCQRTFDSELFSKELFFFKNHYLDQHHPLLKNKKSLEKFNQDTTNLSLFLHNFCRYFTHRDFQCRNILLKRNELFLIDFQDARLGPVAYDLISFTFDPYLNLTINQRFELYEAATKNIPSYTKHSIRKEIEKTQKPLILQRLLKAIGSFAFLDKQNKLFPYKNFIRPTINILKEAKIHDPRWPYLSKQLIEEIYTYEQSS